MDVGGELEAHGFYCLYLVYATKVDFRLLWGQGGGMGQSGMNTNESIRHLWTWPVRALTDYTLYTLGLNSVHNRMPKYTIISGLSASLRPVPRICEHKATRHPALIMPAAPLSGARNIFAW